MASPGLPEVLARYREITELISDPDVASNPARLKDLLKERGQLERKATLYEAWKKTRAEIEETEALLEDPEMAEMATEELERLQSELTTHIEALADEMGSDEADAARSVIVEIRPGTGGDEAALFAADLFEMYRRFAETRRFKFEVLDLQRTDLGGLREATFSVSGRDVYQLLKFE